MNAEAGGRAPAVRRAVVGLAVAAAVSLGAGGCTAAASPPVTAFDVDLPEPFVLAHDFADPDVLETDDGLMAYATQSESAHVQVASADASGAWTLEDYDAFPELPTWVLEGDTWAPEVTEWNGGYLLFHTSTSAASVVPCIGVARSASPRGPFVEVNDRPIVCPQPEGAIDASFFVDDDGAPYLLWKVDGNCCGGKGSIWISALDASGTELTGEATPILETTLLWENDVVEAPTLVRRDGAYVLFYSADDYYSLDYAIGVATAQSLRGPYEKLDEPVLSTESSDFAFVGPGGQDVVGDTVYFHSWDPEHAYRGLNSAALDWTDGAPSVVLPRARD